ncbi:putative O-methyltransferase [Pseudomassariella vexata]|uniref:Putative O-methyltransferase n=1 Tax=Pseudomassariella vexata TaxID=1141098 RepID=A0A1Y2DJA4_9PEZI|nr:putative O-methyltransferase [Pseudomassariella vexata]ORY59300.1 putative O-methyltransferase [Pseudomassariella vexata]
MEDLTRKLVSDVQALSDYIRSTGGVQPSFDRNTPITVVPHDAPLGAQEARERIMDQCLKLLQLATGPSDYMINIQPGYHYIACLQWLCHFNIFRLVPVKGEISYTDLASLAGTTETRLKSVVRMAMTTGLFLEQTPQQISHSATSALFATNEDYHNWAVYATDVSAPVAAGMVEAHKRWPYDKEKIHTAYNVAFNHDLSFFGRLAQNPALHKQFAGYMRAVATNQGTHMKHLVNGLEWGSNPKATIVDVGGSTGHSCIALAQAYPGLNFIVQDLPEVVEGGPKILEGVNDASVSSRIQYQGHNFFETNPVIGADVYLLRMILHDWNFENCVKILGAIVPSMRSKSSIVIMDSVLPAPESVPRSSERIIRVRDLTMIQVFNSQERAVEDWEAILEKVDSTLKISTISQPFGSVLALIKVELAR